jgi:hypothetical protein
MHACWEKNIAFVTQFEKECLKFGVLAPRRVGRFSSKEVFRGLFFEKTVP